MMGFDYGKLNEYRVKELRQEAAGIVAARQAGASKFAKRVARGLRNVAGKIDGEGIASIAQPQLNRVRSLAR
ncbi:MAG TPA: hypothetical protein VFD39_02610 [Trueperaceae bacterium]|nr:hypothetical protein [Trueperaceae bacterium]